MDWDYSSQRGQHKWGEHCKIGDSQSPIDIVHNSTLFDASLETNPLKLGGADVGSITMKVLNKGVNVSFTPSDGADSMTISQGK